MSDSDTITMPREELDHILDELTEMKSELQRIQADFAADFASAIAEIAELPDEH